MDIGAKEKTGPSEEELVHVVTPTLDATVHLAATSSGLHLIGNDLTESDLPQKNNIKATFWEKSPIRCVWLVSSYIHILNSKQYLEISRAFELHACLYENEHPKNTELEGRWETIIKMVFFWRIY